MDLQEIYTKVKLLIYILEIHEYFDYSKMLKNALYYGITSGEILDNMEVCLKIIKKNKLFRKDCLEILKNIKKIK